MTNDEERGQPHVPMRLSLARSSSTVSFALAMSAVWTTGLLALALSAASCRAPQEDMKMHLPHRSEFSAHIRHGTPVSTNTSVIVHVGGEVNRPGRVELPGGSTVLDAIKKAGGFTELGHTRRLWLMRGNSGTWLLLCRRMMGVGFRNHYEAWYVRARWNEAIRDYGPTEKHASEDLMLEPGDGLQVGRCL